MVSVGYTANQNPVDYTRSIIGASLSAEGSNALHTVGTECAKLGLVAYGRYVDGDDVVLGAGHLAKGGLVSRAVGVGIPDMLDLDQRVRDFDLVSLLSDVSDLILDAKTTSRSFAKKHKNFKVVKLKKLVKLGGSSVLLKPIQLEYVRTHPVQYMDWLVSYNESRIAGLRASQINGAHGEYTGSDDVVALPIHALAAVASESIFGVFFRYIVDFFRDPEVESQINGAQGEHTGLDDVKKDQKVKFVAKGKAKSKTPGKVSRNIHPKANKIVSVKKIEQGALAPSMDNSFVTVTDKFRFGEFKDLGTTVETGMGVKSNQLMFVIPVNPRRLLAVGKTNAMLRDNVPIDYKCESYNENSYQYEISSAELTLSGVMPSSVSGEVCAFFTSNLTRTITETNVLDAYESSKHKIAVSGKQVKSLKFSTGTLFINDDPTSNMAPDPTLCFAGLLVMFVRSPVVTAIAVASSSSTPNFSYLGPMVQASLKMTCKYKGFEYAPQNIDSAAGNKYNVDMTTTTIVASPMIVNSADCISVIPTFAVPDQLQSDVITTAYVQTYGGEWIGTTGDLTSPKFNMRLHNIPPSMQVAAHLMPGLVGSVNLLSWSSFTGFIQSAFAKLSALPGEINQRFIDLFGQVAGNALYNVGKKIVSAAISLASGGILVSSSNIGAMNSFDSAGYPIDISGTICTGYIKPGSGAYNQTMDSFLASNQGAYINSVLAQGVQVSFINVVPMNYFHTTGGAQPYVSSQGRIGAWTKPIYGYTEVKPSFGQPSSVGSLEVNPDPLAVSLIAADHVTDRLGADMKRPISFFLHSILNVCRLISSECEELTPGVATPNFVGTSMSDIQAYFGLTSYQSGALAVGIYDVIRLTGHLSLFSGFGASFNSTTKAFKPSELLALASTDAGHEGLTHPAELYLMGYSPTQFDFVFVLLDEVPATFRSFSTLTTVSGSMFGHFSGVAHMSRTGMHLPVGGSLARHDPTHHPLLRLGNLAKQSNRLPAAASSSSCEDESPTNPDLGSLKEKLSPRDF